MNLTYDDMTCDTITKKYSGDMNRSHTFLAPKDIQTSELSWMQFQGFSYLNASWHPKQEELWEKREIEIVVVIVELITEIYIWILQNLDGK